MTTARIRSWVLAYPRHLPAIATMAMAVILLTRLQPAWSAKGERAADDEAARKQSVDNLKQIALALSNYHDTYAGFPPAAFYGRNKRLTKDSKPLLSWRVLILPFLEEFALHRQFKLDEPWDSEHNKKLLAKIPKTYAPVRGKTRLPHSTFYQVFTGKTAGFEAVSGLGGWVGLTSNSFPDGLSNTLLVVEAGEAVPWSKPEDLRYDAKKPLPKLGGLFPDGFHAVFGDRGIVRFIKKKTDEKTLRALITRNGGEDVDPAKLP